MQKMITAAACLALAGTASAQVVSYDFDTSTGPGNGLTTFTVEDPTTGLRFRIDNPNGNAFSPPEEFGFALNGLTIDGGFSPNVDFTFSQNVRLVDYTVSNDENGESFDLTQGPISSLNQSVDDFLTYLFSNTSDVFLGGLPISLTSSNNDGAGYAFGQIRLLITPPASLIGDSYVADIKRNGTPIQPRNDVARFGPDDIGDWFGQLAYNVEPTYIAFRSLIDDVGSSWSAGLSFELSDLDFDDPRYGIVGARIFGAAGTGWDQIDDSDLSFTRDSISVDASDIGGTDVALDQTVRVEMQLGVAGSLIGDDYIANIYLNNSVLEARNDTALAGPDAIGMWNATGSLMYDVEDCTVSVACVRAGGSWSGGIEFEFVDLDFMPAGIEIIGATVESSTGQGWNQIDDSDLSFTADSVRIDASEIQGVVPALGQQVTVKLQLGLADVPCPGDLADSSGFGPPDGQVDFGDFFALSFLAGACGGGTNNPECIGDLADSTGFGPPDDMIDFGDFFALSFLAGPCP